MTPAQVQKEKKCKNVSIGSGLGAFGTAFDVLQGKITLEEIKGIPKPPDEEMKYCVDQLGHIKEWENQAPVPPLAPDNPALTGVIRYPIMIRKGFVADHVAKEFKRLYGFAFDWAFDFRVWLNPFLIGVKQQHNEHVLFIKVNSRNKPTPEDIQTHNEFVNLTKTFGEKGLVVLGEPHYFDHYTYYLLQPKEVMGKWNEDFFIRSWGFMTNQQSL